jgi:hypothetical protein
MGEEGAHMRTPIDMAREAGFMLRAESVKGQSDWWECFDEAIEKLVALVRADERSVEREACAKVCEDLSLSQNSEWEVGTLDCADAIRARGKT